MSQERRFNEAEIAAIFKRASEAQESARRGVAEGEGLTLAELQQIGREAGITPAFIARAAAELDRAEAMPPKRLLGLRITAAHTVDLPGPFAEEDWERLVVDLRDTFHASGRVRRDGTLREWRNGNLHVLVEPVEGGHRLRMHTLKGNARPALFSGLFAAVLGVVMVVSMFVTGDFRLVNDNVMAVLFAVGGLGALGLTARHLAQWRDERHRQMDAIAARALERRAARPEEVLPASTGSWIAEDGDTAEPLAAPQQRMAGRTRT